MSNKYIAWFEPSKGMYRDWITSLPQSTYVAVLFSFLLLGPGGHRHSLGPLGIAVRIFFAVLGAWALGVVNAFGGRKVQFFADEVIIGKELWKSKRTFDFSKISRVVFELSGDEPSVVIYRGGKRGTRIWLSPKQIPPAKLRAFLESHGVRCEDAADTSYAPRS